MSELAPPFVHAIGWATVELDRAAAELEALLAAGASFLPAPDCELLGARCRVAALGEVALGELARSVAASGASAGVALPPRARFVVLLEPSTEGRMANTLARHGESWCATWTIEDAGSDPAATLPRRTSERAGPFGPERLILDSGFGGPHHLLLRAATIGT